MTLGSFAVLKTDGCRLFEPANLTFGAERIGLVGRNGCGKSSLLRAIGQQDVPSEGSIAVAGRVWTLPQVTIPVGGETVADALGVAEAMAVIDRVLDGNASDADLEAADWQLDDRIERALSAMGLQGVSVTSQMANLSGGQRTRAYLAGMMLAAPDVALLDEPTNHLDAGGRQAVMDLIENWDGCLIIASHDRSVLSIVDRIVEVSPSGLRSYGGNYDSYRHQRDLELDAALAAAESADRALSNLKREVQESRERRAKRDSSGRKFAQRGSIPKIALGLRKSAAQASAGREVTVMAKRLEEGRVRAETANQSLERVSVLDIPVPSAGLAAGADVLKLDQVQLDLGSGPLFEPISAHLCGPVRVALNGPNGSGKSTLLRAICGLAPPAAGSIKAMIEPVMLDQDVSILCGEETLRDAWLRLNPTGTVEEAQAALARFLFRNTAAQKRVDDLSGGERVRAGLACTVGGKPAARFLLLDEPTNHLDLDAVQAVEQVLSAYDGALIVVSHDPHFLEAIGVEQEIRLSPPN
ncbi:ABC-F family ATP-binding cassette domain-containing protein [uncultured Brevundimonas sp.]|uniref:ABC-F family ATP-binding cassette domain-containing protein n=1 Tax=uncultured Brevundimonas sp. TaxID=213418 RepID=UPI0026338556|nr:ABC-F family ATP-binding cassette domain-containing protein [uncultured Brevundimonas sp.]